MNNNTKTPLPNLVSRFAALGYVRNGGDLRNITYSHLWNAKSSNCPVELINGRYYILDEHVPVWADFLGLTLTAAPSPSQPPKQLRQAVA